MSPRNLLMCTYLKWHLVNEEITKMESLAGKLSTLQGGISSFTSWKAKLRNLDRSEDTAGKFVEVT